MGAKGNSGGKKGRSGRKGYNHQIVVQEAYEIVRKGLIGELKDVKQIDQFKAAVELVKKSLPTNVNLGGELKVMFNEVFNTPPKTEDNSTESSKV